MKEQKRNRVKRMHIFIDESGGFQCTNKPAAPSCVGAVTIPGRHLQEVEDGFRTLTANWLSDEGEIKGKLLRESDFEQLCEFLEPHAVLFECSVIDMGCATEADVSRHRRGQAEGMTRALTPEHHPNVVAEIYKLRSVLEAMPLQLYCELVTLTDVVWRALGHGMSYYCQRLAGELARFRLVIDAKSNLNITPHEEWWRQCVKPLLQSLSIREPLPMLKSGDYSAFRRNFPSLPVPDYLREHVPSNLVSVGDLSGILREIEFDDSRQQVGLQIADALTNCVRRALIGNVQADGWRHVRKLMIRRRGGAVKFISMGSGGPIRERPYGLVAKMLAEGHRSMLTERRRRSSGAPWSRGAGRA